MPSDDGTGPAQDGAVYQIGEHVGELSSLNMALNLPIRQSLGGSVAICDLNARLVKANKPGFDRVCWHASLLVNGPSK